MKSLFMFATIVACTISCGLSVLAADEEPVAAESPSKGPSPETTAQPTPSSVSPDKKWEYKAPTEEGPKLVKTGTYEIAADLSDVCDISSCGDYASVIWARIQNAWPSIGGRDVCFRLRFINSAGTNGKR